MTRLLDSVYASFSFRSRADGYVMAAPSSIINLSVLLWPCMSVTSNWTLSYNGQLTTLHYSYHA